MGEWRVGSRLGVLVAVLVATSCGGDPERVSGTARQTTTSTVLATAAPPSAPVAVPAVPGTPGTPGTPGSPSVEPGSGDPDPGGLAPGPAVPLGLTDTGFTRLRVTIESEAEWATAELHGVAIRAVRVVGATGAVEVTSLGPVLAVAGRGAATLDLVVAIAPGQPVTLLTCKNYLGPATTSITRLTDGEVAVATVTNSARDPVVGSRPCENHQWVPLDRAALIGPTRWPARTDPRPLVLANYYPWYGPQELARDFGDQPAGPADTSDPTAVRESIDLAAAAGIDGFVIEYEATPALEPRIDDLYRIAGERGGFHLAMLLDLDILARRHGTISAGTLDHALRAILARAGHPHQLRVGQQPVLFVYGAARVTGGQWHQALDRLGLPAEHGFFVIPDAAHLGAPGRYEYGTHHLADRSLLDGWAHHTVEQLRLRPGLDGHQGPLWVAPVSPGYDDRRLNRPSPLYVDRAGGQRYVDSWQAAIGTLPDWIMVTSWNEYYEQTHVAPGVTTGERALGQTAEFAAVFHANG